MSVTRRSRDHRSRRDKRGTVEERKAVIPAGAAAQSQFLRLTPAQQQRHAHRDCFYAGAHEKPCEPVAYVVVHGTEVRLLCPDDGRLYADLFNLPIPS